jgi:hypothetical protein
VLFCKFQRKVSSCPILYLQSVSNGYNLDGAARVLHPVEYRIRSRMSPLSVYYSAVTVGDGAREREPAHGVAKHHGAGRGAQRIVRTCSSWIWVRRRSYLRQNKCKVFLLLQKSQCHVSVEGRFWTSLYPRSKFLH